MRTLSSIQKKIQENKKELNRIEESIIDNQKERNKLDNKIKLVETKTGKALKKSDPLFKKRVDIQNKLNLLESDARNINLAELELKTKFFKANSHPSLMENLSSDFPVLLFPVRLETRFMKLKHVVTGIQSDIILDLAEISPEERKTVATKLNRISQFISAQSVKDNNIEADRTKTLVPSLPIGLGAKKPRPDNIPNLPDKAPDKGYERINDKEELWLRIYPDEIFVHTHEEGLTEDEKDSSQSFWEEIYKTDSITTINDKDRYSLKVAAWKALVSGYGTSRASYIARLTMPSQVNIVNGEPILNTSPVLPNVTVKESSWTKAPCAYALPDQFVVRLYSNGKFREVVGTPIPEILILGLNPEDNDDKTFEMKGEERNIPDDIKWLTDFEEAEKIGMAIRIPISKNEFKQGFEKIVVLGVKLSQNEEHSKETVERLFINHKYALGGMSLLKQGTPTNNTSDVSIDPDFDEIRSNNSFKSLTEPLYIPTDKHEEKKDGQFLAEALGIDHKIVQHLADADSTDICEAIAMNKALYPATLGYSLNQFYHNILTESIQRETRKFFEDFVIGRGLIPTIRVNNQPYGIIPSSSLSKWEYTNDSSERYYKALNNKVLSSFRKIWKNHINTLTNLTEEDTANSGISDRFLDIIGLHASSVDFFQRFISGPQAKTNFPGQAHIKNMELDNKNKFLSTFSIDASRIIDYGFLNDVKELFGPVIDQQKLSELKSLRKLKGTDKNYIDFLIESGLQAIREENFAVYSPENPVPPVSLLYLLLRHSILREYINVAADLRVSGNTGSILLKHDFELDQISEDRSIRPEHEAVLTEILVAKNIKEIERKTSEQLNATISDRKKISERKKLADELVKKEVRDLNKEISFEITRQRSAYSIEKSKFESFEKQFPQLTGNLTLGDYIEKLKNENSTKTISLNHLKNSLKRLKDLPTARLERCFAEHLDCCNYRLDAWQLGLISQRLFKMRQEKGNGIYIGAFALLEKLKPSGTPGVHIEEIKNPKFTAVVPRNKKVFNPVIDSSKFKSKSKLDLFLKKSHVYLGEDNRTEIIFNQNTNKFSSAPVENRSLSDGFIHTPSTNHAIAAALLKSGFDSHENGDSLSDALAVKLESKRVRKALYFLQGMRNGQEIAALLGYQFERGLHENPMSGLDQLILDIRTKYPFNADKINSIGDAEADLAEAFNVVDGLSLLKDFQENDKVPNKITGINNISENQIKSIKEELSKLDETMDSVNDLMVAESIFQMVVGSPDGSSAALKILNESGEINQMPEVVNIPRKGISVTHRVGIQFPIDDKVVSWTSNKASARSKFASSVNNWLEKQLPVPDKICVRVEINDGATIKEVSMADILIEPIDFILSLGAEVTNTQNGMIPIRVKHFLVKHDNSVSHLDKLFVLFNDNNFSSSGKVCLFEILPLVKSLYQILTSSRQVMPEDLMEQSKSAIQTDGNGTLNNHHLFTCLDDLINQNVNDSLTQIQSDLSTALLNLAPIVSEEQIISASDYNSYIQLCQKLIDASVYNLPAAIPDLDLGFTFQTRDYLVQKASSVITQLTRKQEEARTVFNSVPFEDDDGGRKIFEKIRSVSQILFGKQFPVYPRFRISNKDEFEHAFRNDEILDQNNKYAVEDWLLGLSVVRTPLKNYQTLMHLREIFSSQDKNKLLEPVQLPYIPGENNKWLGLTVSKKENIPLDPLSLVFEFPDNYSASTEQMALIVDEWTEIIPEDKVDSGIALHYSSPNNEASQSILIAVPPVERGDWQWEQLIDCVNDTFEMAKMRAVEPKHLRKDSLLFRILPGIISAVNAEGNTPSVDFGRNNASSTFDQALTLLDNKFTKAFTND